MKRLLVWLIVLSLLCLTGCGGGPDVSDPMSLPDLSTEEPPETGLKNLTLAYSHDDTLDPFAAATQVNLYLASLLYESLTRPDETFTVQNQLAAKVETPDATHLVVTLRQGAKFSDGTAVKPADVIESFRKAKASANYQALLSNITAATGDEKARQITFTLATPDVNGTGSLAFPVVKKGTFTKKAAQSPVGSGPYMYETTDMGARLVRNPHGGATLHFQTVGLRHLPNAQAQYYALSAGNIAYYYNDLSSGDAPELTGAHLSVPMNALVYVGINSYSKSLGQAQVRCALSALLDRPAVATVAYRGRGEASRLPFHKGWSAMKALKLPSASRDLDGGIRLLEEAGCKPGKGGNRLELELIYCKDRSDRGQVAELLRTQWAGGGVAVTLVPLEEKEYRDRLKKWKFDLYLGEIRLTEDMSLRPLLMGGGAGYGVNTAGAAGAAYARYLNGEIPLQAFLDAFGEDMPYIPVCWKNGLASYNRRLTTVTPTGFDPYYGLAGWQ